MGNKILIIGNGLYARPFIEHGECVFGDNFKIPEDFKWDDIKLVVFTGGPDVDPNIYKHPKHPSTISDLQRDKMDSEYYFTARRNEIPIVGICRGAQFLTVMNGGTLIQDVFNHAISGTHTIIDREGNRIEVTSTHHQMMNPSGKYELLAWASGLSPVYYTGHGKWYPKNNKHIEPEVVWFPKSKSLAVQYHPEKMNKDTLGYQYFQNLLKEYVL